VLKRKLGKFAIAYLHQSSQKRRPKHQLITIIGLSRNSKRNCTGWFLRCRYLQKRKKYESETWNTFYGGGHLTHPGHLRALSTRQANRFASQVMLKKHDQYSVINSTDNAILLGPRQLPQRPIANLLEHDL